MRNESGTLPPAPAAIVLEGPVKQLAIRYFRLRNLLIEIRDTPSVPEVIKDRIRVWVGINTKPTDMAEIERTTEMRL